MEKIYVKFGQKSPVFHIKHLKGESAKKVKNILHKGIDKRDAK